MATYAIGDLQGCAATLDRLLATLPLAAGDRLWFVGDLVNRGPASAETLRLIRRLGARAVVVLGNHDLYLVARAAGLAAMKKRDTLEPVLREPDCAALCAWLRRQPLLHREGPYVLVHAGLPPRWTADEAAALAARAQAALAGADGERLAAAALRLPSRLPAEALDRPAAEAVIAVLTGIRTVDAAGTPDFAFKRAPAEAPPGYVPWFDAPGRRNADVTVVFGHWSALGLHVGDGAIGVDTGCVWGRTLTAVRLEDRRIFAVACVDDVVRGDED
jgi:bis(5'-nucleosyl)-tetraphosphatase (symmetrical)